MWTQRDQLQAVQFLRRRIVSAIQFGDAGHPVAPGRRVMLATVAGLGSALLIAGGFAIFAVLRPGSAADWRATGQILVEKESGSSYVLGADGLVHPVLNHASARLLIGGGRTTTIRARALAEAPRGRPLGIPNAPASLSPPDDLIAGPWSVCVTPTGGPAATTLAVGVPVPPARLGRGQGLVVQDPDGTRYLVADGRRFRMPDNAVVALGYDGVPPRLVSPAWLAVLASGPDLALLDVPGRRGGGPPLAGRATRAGQVLMARGVGGPDRYYMVTTGALVPVTQTEAALLVGNPATRTAYADGVPRPLIVAAADISASGRVARRDAEQGYPDRLPSIVPVQAALCAGGDGAGPRILWTAGAPPLPPGARALPITKNPNARTADQVYVTSGAAALVAEPGGKVSLVSDQGVRFPVREHDDLAALGYGDAPVTTVAAGLLALLPSGPELSAEAAQQETDR
jgi:type VII secretion protein EccB